MIFFAIVPSLRNEAIPIRTYSGRNQSTAASVRAAYKLGMFSSTQIPPINSRFQHRRTDPSWTLVAIYLPARLSEITRNCVPTAVSNQR